IVEEAPTLDVQETTLNLKLHGVWSDGDRSTAMIKIPNGKQKVFGIGDEIVNGVTLDAVYANQVTILRGGVRESLKLPKDIPEAVPQRRSAARAATPPTAREASGARSLLDVIRAQPRRDERGAFGVVLTAASGQDNAFEALGLRSGDLLVEVEDEPVTGDLQQFNDILKSLLGARSASIVVERDEVELPLTIALSDGDGFTDDSN
ncbi:MAG: type II secretion system protein N, partial [Pseudomonadota bacterium]